MAFDDFPVAASKHATPRLGRGRSFGCTLQSGFRRGEAQGDFVQSTRGHHTCRGIFGLRGGEGSAFLPVPSKSRFSR